MFVLIHLSVYILMIISYSNKNVIIFQDYVGNYNVMLTDVENVENSR